MCIKILELKKLKDCAKKIFLNIFKRLTFPMHELLNNVQKKINMVDSDLVYLTLLCK